ncbi:MAG: chloride channel protein, partial [Pseudomonadota bacterium]
MLSKMPTGMFKSIQSIRETLSMPTVSLQLCLVGLAAGFIASCVIIIFRFIVYTWHEHMMGSLANYAALEPIIRLFLPIAAMILVLCVALLTGFKHYRLGIPFVIHRLKFYYGHVPFGSTINQFFGGILALGSGFVVGKEGPTVHLAAAVSHYIGRWMRLPFNSLRIIAGCGVAAGIAAAFNTPFAAVIFVMEVVLREYRVHVFLPVMLAAACGSVLTRSVFGDVYALSFLTFEPVGGWELLYLVLFGFVIGCVASLFNFNLMFLMRSFRNVNMFLRLLLAATLTGVVGYFFPQALGADFVNIAPLVATDLELKTLFIIFAAKFLLASVAIALGVPGGI